MAQPDRCILRTQRLVLEPITSADNEDLYQAVVSHDSVMRWLATGRADSRDAAKQMCKEYEAHWARHGYGYFAVREEETRAFLGWAGLRSRPEFGVDLGFALRPEAQGRGIAREAGRACLDLAFRKIRIPVIWAFVLPDNQPSKALLARLGAQEAGTTWSSGNLCLRMRFDAPTQHPAPVA